MIRDQGKYKRLDVVVYEYTASSFQIGIVVDNVYRFDDYEDRIGFDAYTIGYDVLAMERLTSGTWYPSRVVSVANKRIVGKLNKPPFDAEKVFEAGGFINSDN